MRIGLVIGHHEQGKGAYSPHLKVSEWDFYNEVIEHFKAIHTKHDFYVFRHDANVKGYNTRMKNTAAEINRVGVDLVILLHFNSHASDASGCETLYTAKSDEGKRYAKLFNDHVCEWIDVKNRGIKPKFSGDRGFGELYYTDAPTILIEPFFGSSESDCKEVVNANYMAQILNDFLTCKI